jgi:hypothetical protein
MSPCGKEKSQSTDNTKIGIPTKLRGLQVKKKNKKSTKKMK